MRKFVVVDLETTGHTPSKGDKIIEIGIVVVEDGEIKEKYNSLINPNVEIPVFISKLTGINDDDVKGAPTFAQVANEIIPFFEHAYIVAHNVPFDLGFLNYELQSAGFKAIHAAVIDTVELARILLPQAPGFKLGQLSEYLSIKHHDPHRALSDAYVTAKLLQHLFNKLHTLPYETLHQLQQMETGLKSDLRVILEEQMEKRSFEDQFRDDLEIFRGIAIKKDEQKQHNKQAPGISYGELLDTIYPNGQSLSQLMKSYEYREGQREMSELIYDAFQMNQHALIEAETGTGKSLAYLIPAIYEAITNRERLVISTHLTQLQTQLLEKEIPLLKRILAFDFDMCLLKGKQHYISLSKFEKELFSSGQDNYDITLTKAILLIWLTETNTGDIDEVQLPSSGQQFFKRISAEAEGAVDPFSPWFSRSFFQRVRNNAQRANIIITNHSLLCTDLTSEYNLLPSYTKVIIDEAHHLEATAAKHLGLKLDYINIQFMLNRIGTISNSDWLGKINKNYPMIDKIVSDYNWDKWWQNAKNEVDDLFRFLFSYVVEQHKNDVSVNDIGRLQYRMVEDKEPSDKWNAIKEMVTRLSFNLRDLIHILSTIKQTLSNIEDQVDELDVTQTHIEQLQIVIDDLEQLFLQRDESKVKWIEIEAYGARNAVYLFSEPVDVSSILFEQLFSKKKSVILTSATLTMKNSFRFVRERLGLADVDVLEKKIESPYAYESQVQLMIPNDFPDFKYGNQDDFIYATCEAILSLAHISNGRMLVLFTSYDMLKKSYNLLREIMDEDDFMIIAQGVSSGSRSRLKKNFQAFEKAILLGTSSFWEGVDIPGSDLSCLMIVRLPFQPPDHPIYEAKSSHIKEIGKNPFMELALPNAVIRFKQGFGRLIRSSTDRGVVFICDDRIMKARYGKYFVDSIPKVPVHYMNTKKIMGHVEDWL
ncbi:ATP-dependent DNA helicase DinG [Aquibacillus koreensis]|uniref:3'-5' exonuclease DinG n=1 Tax=Aquibacillus koreensis TaxID=279446 RepID=A0A9X3WK57_9BACI|nr:ATP-dependent DNA helicase DinG [Aquibacillus koreensis]MCT2537358.1 ATP-dependent DNA helicase DinG [Aquibacillus koreensis]MDC3418804.1 ATP-dependent DNA helicase DinG [Aquibacillus koreensis]